MGISLGCEAVLIKYLQATHEQLIINEPAKLIGVSHLMEYAVYLSKRGKKCAGFRGSGLAKSYSL